MGNYCFWSLSVSENDFRICISFENSCLFLEKKKENVSTLDMKIKKHILFPVPQENLEKGSKIQKFQEFQISVKSTKMSSFKERKVEGGWKLKIDL